MNDALEAILDEFGWGRTKQRLTHPYFARSIEFRLNERGGRYFNDARASQHALHKLDDLRSSINRTLEILREIPPEAIDAINISSSWGEDLDRGTPDKVHHATKRLRTIYGGVCELLSQVDKEAGEPKRGRVRNDAAYEVAKALAEIYFLVEGKKPTYGRSAVKAGDPTGKFSKLVADVYDVLGIKVGDVARPCKAAVKALDTKQIKRLSDIRTGEFMKRRSIAK